SEGERGDDRKAPHPCELKPKPPWDRMQSARNRSRALHRGARYPRRARRAAAGKTLVTSVGCPYSPRTFGPLPPLKPREGTHVDSPRPQLPRLARFGRRL